MTIKKVCSWLIAVTAVSLPPILFSGCASAKYQPVVKAPGNIPKPDFIQVNRLAVDAGDVKADDGLLADLSDSLDETPRSKREKEIGARVAEVFSEQLLRDLRVLGINAHPATSTEKPTAKTLIIKGAFTHLNEGDQTQRVVIGFGMGATKLQARLEAWQDGKKVAIGEVESTPGMRPGIIVPVGIGAAAKTIAVSSTVGAGAQMTGEYLSGLEEDAVRAADKVAKRIAEAYVKRGWLPPERLDRLDSILP